MLLALLLVRSFVPGLASAQSFLTPNVLNTNAAGDSGGDTRADLATDGNGTWVAVWSSTENMGGSIGTDSDIFFARSLDDGATWSTPSVLNSSAATDIAATDLEPRIVVSGTLWVVVWSSTHTIGGIGSDADLLVATSSNGGLSWSSATALNANAASDSGNDTEPALDVDGGGDLLVAWTSNDTLSGTIGSDSDILFARSTDGGASWSGPAALASYASTDSSIDWGVDVACQLGPLCVAVWTSNYSLGGTIGTDQDILTSRSLNFGSSWSGAASLKSNAATDGTYADLHPHIASNGAGTWIVGWDSTDPTIAAGTDQDVVFARGVQGGIIPTVTWSAAAALSNLAGSDTVTDSMYGLEADGAGNWIAYWGTSGWWGTDADLAQVRSSDDGLIWSSQDRLNVDAHLDGGANDYYPIVVTDRAGSWLAVWQTNNTVGSTIGTDDDLFVSLGWGPDADGDGLADGAEVNVHGTSPVLSDTDGDGLSDGDEVNTHGTNPLLADTDGDGLTDGDEVNTHGTDPLLADSDGDGLTDGAEVNTHGTDPLLADTDGDGFSDGAEIAAGTDPLDDASFPAVPLLSPGARVLLLLMMVTPGALAATRPRAGWWRRGRARSTMRT